MNSPDDRAETIRVVVDRSLCIGSGMCTTLAPDTFELDDDGVLVLREEGATTGTQQGIDDAIACCPVEALSVAAE